MLKLKVLHWSLDLSQVHAPNAISEYQTFVDEVNNALLQVSSTESTVLMGILTHMLEQTQIRGRVWSENLESLDWMRTGGTYCSSVAATDSASRIPFSSRKSFTSIWYLPSNDQESLIDFCTDSPDLFSDLLDVRVKRSAELSTDHHLVVYSLRLLKLWPNRKFNRSSVT